MEHIERHGGNAFKDYQLQEAALTLRQGVGRLIRSEVDFGAVMIGDRRLTHRPYGRTLLAALPPDAACALPGGGGGVSEPPRAPAQGRDAVLKILALDTATEVCSVALLVRDATVGAGTAASGPGHSAHILGMVQGVLSEAGIALQELDCIAFGRGPGGFTGLRLAASVTQGLAFGAGLPVVPVSDLLAVAQQALDLAPRPAACWCATMRACRRCTGAAPRAGPSGLAQAAGPEAGELARSGFSCRTELPGPVLGAGRGFALWPQLALPPGGTCISGSCRTVTPGTGDRPAGGAGMAGGPGTWPGSGPAGVSCVMMSRNRHVSDTKCPTS